MKNYRRITRDEFDNAIYTVRLFLSQRVDDIIIEANGFEKDLGESIFNGEIEVRTLNVIRDNMRDLGFGHIYNKDLKYGHFQTLSRNNLIRCRNFGKGSMKKLENVLEKHGIYLRD